MAVEIERKFLVADLSVLDGCAGVEMVQGYLSEGGHGSATVRVRIAGECAWLTIKGGTRGITRSEFEYPVPAEDARSMLAELTTRPPIRKTRYVVHAGGLDWEIDVFHDANDGLVVAEVELDSAGQQVQLPPWVGAEVSDDPRYFNARLYELPYSQWHD